MRFIAMSPDERRTNERLPVSQEVMLSEGMHFRMCRIRDLSLSGAFLEVGWGALTRDTSVDLALTIGSGHDHQQVYHVPAQVARISTEGTAVRFKFLDRPTFEALSDLLGRGK